MTAVRRLMAAAVIVPLVAGSIVLGGSAPAGAVTLAAGGEITSPSEGQIVSGGSVQISARTDLLQLSMGLYVDGPGVSKQRVARGGGNQTISGAFDTSSASNGTFTVTLHGEITGTDYKTRTFKVRRPAAEPSGVAANLQGNEKIVVTWSKGSESDLQAYEISTSQTGSVGRVNADSACSGGSCKATLAVPSKAAGQKVGFTVKAFRSDGDGGSVASGNSNVAYVTVPAAAPPQTQSAKTGTQQSATEQKTGKQTTGTPQTNKKNTSTVENLPQLPAKDANKVKPTAKPRQQTVPDTTKLPAIPESQTNDKGEFKLPTADSGTTEKTDDTTKDGALVPESDSGKADTGKADTGDETAVVETGVKAQSSESPIGNIGQYGMFVAGGLLLLLLAAHGGAWARRRSLAAEGGSAGPGASMGAPEPGGGDGPQHNESIPPTTSAPRRPAVVLAVAKTRQPHVPEQVASQTAPDVVVPRALPLYLSADEVRMPHQELGRMGEEDSQGAAGVRRPGVGRPGAGRPGAGRSAHVGSGRVDHQAAAGRAGHLGTDRAEHHAAAVGPEPIRLALPSSAVTVVPAAEVAAPPVAVRIEDRWDDYLPPAPRSMEDSGFWERPQPGAADFWAADDDEAYVAHRRPEGDS